MSRGLQGSDVDSDFGEAPPPGEGDQQADRFGRRRMVSELLDRQRTAQARPLIAAALVEDPDDLGMLFQAARADWIDDRFDDARRCLADILRREPGHLDARCLLVAVLTESNDVAEAESMVLALLQEFPESPGLYGAYARVMLRAMHVEKASALVAEALRLAPDDAEALRLRSLCDLVMGVSGQDSVALQRLLVEHPEDQSTLAVLVSSLVHAGRHREALRCARQLLRANPGSAHWLQVTRELTAATHWSMWPLWPLQRFGWGASIGLWLATIVVLRLLSNHAPGVAGPASWLMLAYVAYSWVWPSLFRRWVLRD